MFTRGDDCHLCAEGVVDEGAAAAMTADISKYEADARRMAAGSKK